MENLYRLLNEKKYKTDKDSKMVECVIVVFLNFLDWIFEK